MDKLRVTGTGLTGLVGSRIVECLQDQVAFTVIPSTEMDITDKDSVNRKLYDLDFDIFLHAAAYTNVDGAESDYDIAHKMNSVGTQNVFETISNKRKKFIYISTDFVFDGEHAPADESTIPNPISKYGMTKLEGEKIVGKNGMIVRISYPYRARFDQKKDIVRNIITSLKEGKRLGGVSDQMFTYTLIDDIAGGLLHLFQNFSPEIFHLVGSDSVSGYDSILAICDEFYLDKSKVDKITYDQFYTGRAPRPKNGTTISKKNNFYPMRNLSAGLSEIKRQMSS